MRRAKNDERVRCIDSFCHGNELFAEGGIYRSGDIRAVLKQNGGSFVPGRLDPRGDRGGERPHSSRPAIPSPSPRGLKPEVKRVRAKRSELISGAYMGRGFVNPRAATALQAGDELAADHPLVRLRPELFESVSDLG